MDNYTQAAQINAFRRFHQQNMPNWKATCTEGNALSIEKGERYTVRFDRPQRPGSIPPYESYYGPGLDRDAEKLRKRGFVITKEEYKEFDTVLQRECTTLTAVIVSLPGNSIVHPERPISAKM